MNQDNRKDNKKHSSKQIIALIGVILIALVAIMTLIAAFLDPTGHFFGACMVLMIGLPILLWIYLWLYGIYTQKHTIASLDILNDLTDTDTDIDADADQDSKI